MSTGWAAPSSRGHWSLDTQTCSWTPKTSSATRTRVHKGVSPPSRRKESNADCTADSSQLSSKHTTASRNAVLNFFDADPSEYAVVFTQNATAALKLVGESFPWAKGSHYVVPVDAHNSVHGIRCFAEAHGAQVSYYDCGDRGGPNMLDLHVRATVAYARLSIQC